MRGRNPEGWEEGASVATAVTQLLLVLHRQNAQCFNAYQR
jgi:hypothetical protein